MAFASTRLLKRRLAQVDPQTALGQWYEETYKYTQVNTDTGGTLFTIPADYKRPSITLGGNGGEEEASIHATTGVVTITSPGGGTSATIGYATVKYALAG